VETIAAHSRTSAPADDGRTRDRVSALLMEHGPQTATELATLLGISPAAVRRHLDALVATGRVDERLSREAHRGRGRPARRFHLTDAGRSSFPHAYDDLALTEQRCSTAVEQASRGHSGAPVDRAQALAEALTAEGYAATASALSGGGQLCQHHCPVAHVAAEFPQLCEAETAVIGRLVGTHVQRLATIAHGDGICTTHIPGARYERPGNRTARAGSVPSNSTATAEARTALMNARERTPV
jgi:predicted ArsR family transcriptional regulator